MTPLTPTRMAYKTRSSYRLCCAALTRLKAALSQLESHPAFDYTGGYGLSFRARTHSLRYIVDELERNLNESTCENTAELMWETAGMLASIPVARLGHIKVGIKGYPFPNEIKILIRQVILVFETRVASIFGFPSGKYLGYTAHKIKRLPLP
jgi:hypothetical protein